jgi:hypothetical protein
MGEIAINGGCFLPDRIVACTRKMLLAGRWTTFG